MLLLTVGQANHGITDPAVLIRHAAELTEAGITTTTLGYGDDFNEDLLTHHERHPEGEGLAIVLGDLVSEAEHALVFTPQNPAIPAEGPAVFASVTVAYDAVAEGIRAREVTQDIRVGVVPADQVAAIHADAAVTREVLVLRVAGVLEAAIAQADAGDMAGALQQLKAFLRRVLPCHTCVAYCSMTSGRQGASGMIRNGRLGSSAKMVRVELQIAGGRVSCESGGPHPPELTADS